VFCGVLPKNPSARGCIMLSDHTELSSSNSSSQQQLFSSRCQYLYTLDTIIYSPRTWQNTIRLKDKNCKPFTLQCDDTDWIKLTVNIINNTLYMVKTYLIYRPLRSKVFDISREDKAFEYWTLLIAATFRLTVR